MSTAFYVYNSPLNSSAKQTLLPSVPKRGSSPSSDPLDPILRSKHVKTIQKIVTSHPSVDERTSFQSISSTIQYSWQGESVPNASTFSLFVPQLPPGTTGRFNESMKFMPYIEDKSCLVFFQRGKREVV